MSGSRLHDDVAQAYHAATLDHTSEVEAQLLNWSARELLVADDLFRRWWFGYVDARVNDLAAAFHPSRVGVVWMASMSRDGHLRERAVAALAGDSSAVADRLLALRLADSVPAVRLRAWNALARRLSPQQIERIVPVLVALRSRVRASDALSRYAQVYLDATGAQLSTQLRDSGDRATRRWAFREALRLGSIGPAEAAHLIDRERDQLICAQLITCAARTDDVAQLRALLTLKRPKARAAVLMALGEAAQQSELEQGLLDRAAQVRVVAQWVATKKGLALVEFYREQWQASGNPWALAGAFEVGVPFSRSEVLELCGHECGQVRKLAMRRLGPALNADEVRWLFASLDEPASASTATKVLARGFGWTYAEVVGEWAAADVIKRRRLWRLLVSRGGWDRVRADLLAMTDSRPEVASQGLQDLHSWQQHSAVSMYRAPTPDQRGDLVRDLARVELPGGLREAIEGRFSRS